LILLIRCLSIGICCLRRQQSCGDRAEPALSGAEGSRPSGAELRYHTLIFRAVGLSPVPS